MPAKSPRRPRSPRNRLVPLVRSLKAKRLPSPKDYKRRPKHKKPIVSEES